MVAFLITKLEGWIGPYLGYLEPEYQVWTHSEKNTPAGQRGGVQIGRNQPLLTPVWTVFQNFKTGTKFHMWTTYGDHICRCISLLDEENLGPKSKSHFSRKGWFAIFDPPKTALRVADSPGYSLWVKVRSYGPTQPPQIIYLSRGLVKGILESSDSCSKWLLKITSIGVQRPKKWLVYGLVKSAPAVPWLFCLALPGCLSPS